MLRDNHVSPAPSDLVIVKDEQGQMAFIQAVCDHCTFRGTVYPAKFAELAVAMANRHDAMFHGDYTGYRLGVAA